MAEAPTHITREPERVLVTGTTGRVGKAIMPALRQRFPGLAEFDLRIEDPNNHTTFKGDIRDMGALALAVGHVKPDCIVHLAANANQDAPAYEISGPNIVGLRNVYATAVGFNVPKIVYASSLHTVSGYDGFPDRSPFEGGRKFSPRDAVKPGNPYGHSKVYGERLATQYHDKHGIQTTVLRIGDVNDANVPGVGTVFETVWLSHADAAQAVEKAITVHNPDDPVPIYFVTSDNNGVYDIAPTIEGLGYVPVDGVAK